jgi:hypothetical protein
MRRQKFGNLDTVLSQSSNCQRGFDRRSRFAVGSARATLVPHHDCEVPLPRFEKAIGEGTHDVAGAPMQVEHNGVAAVLPFNSDPLFDASNGNEHLLTDRARGRFWRDSISR